MKTTVLLFNGPPRSGKDTCCEYLHSRGLRTGKFADRLFRDVQAILGISDDRMKFLREKGKDLLLFDDNSLRDIAINYSEKIAKPRFGEDVWGNFLLSEIRESTVPICISDLGFQREYDFLCAQPDLDVYVIKIYREGCDFSKDSRNYVKSPSESGICNNESVEELRSSLELLFNIEIFSAKVQSE